MPSFAEIDDVVAGTPGRIRYERRTPSPPGSAPPLVLLGGMTQTVSSWAGQLRPLSAHRDVLAYEARGQGSTQLSLHDCGPARHVADFEALIEALGLPTPIDLCGFSFGGRVALAIAASRPDLVRKLVLTGVALDRGVVGRLIVQGWIASLKTGDLEVLARISLPDILGPAYLEKHAELIDSMVETSIARNRYDGIKALFEAMLTLPPDSEYAPASLAGKVRAPVLVMSGALDRLAPPAEATALAELMGGQYQRFEGCGHTVPIEDAAAWRAAVEAFLDR